MKQFNIKFRSPDVHQGDEFGTMQLRYNTEEAARQRFKEYMIENDHPDAEILEVTAKEVVPDIGWTGGNTEQT